MVLVLGSEDAPDTRQLTALARSSHAKANVIGAVTDIGRPGWPGRARVGLAESTVAPPGLAAQVTEALSGLGPLSVTRRVVHTEVTGRPAGLVTGPGPLPLLRLMLFPTSLVGSYPQPDWLIDRDRLRHRFPPRVRAKELWRVAPEYLEQAQHDATVLAIRAQERAGLDIITDGEIRRESYSNRFATALDGVDIDHPGTALDRSGHPNPVPRITGPIRRRHPVEVADLQFLRGCTSRTIKITVPGPFTMAQQAQNDYYGDPEALALGYAEAVNEEVADLFAAGADIVQLDEPYLQARPEEAKKYGVRVINRALDGHHRHHRRAPVLRLRGHHPRPAVGLLVPARAGRLRLRPWSPSRPRSPAWTARC